MDEEASPVDRCVARTAKHAALPAHSAALAFEGGLPPGQEYVLGVRNTFLELVSESPSTPRASERRSLSCPPLGARGEAPLETAFRSSVTPISAPGSAQECILGSAALPTLGSAGHWDGTCQPCAFMHSGCSSGAQCSFCHLCDLGERKRRRKQKIAKLREQQRLEQAASKISAAASHRSPHC